MLLPKKIYPCVRSIVERRLQLKKIVLRVVTIHIPMESAPAAEQDRILLTISLLSKISP